MPPFLHFPSVTALLVGSLLTVSAMADDVLLRYSFPKGNPRPVSPESGEVLYANPLSTQRGSLVGISPTQEQCFVLFKGSGQMIPTSAEEALESPHSASFSITPVEGKEIRLRELTFAVGAASTRLAGRFHVLVKAQAGGSDFDLPVAFVREGEEGAGYPIRKGDQRDAMEGRGIVDLSSLPSPLDTPVTFRLHFYLDGVSQVDLDQLPEGTNYSVRLDDISLKGEAR